MVLLLIEIGGSADLSTMPEEEYSSGLLGRPLTPITQRHLERVKVFKQETWELRDLVHPKACAYPRATSARTLTLGQRDLAAPAAST
ncbi:hypothetical protein BGZ72_002674 [Mortierella alpina]|nr:hypothetical protein BGZ72_002674 [Mortierella alpina]